MTEEECKALKRGDTVFYKEASSYGCNAIVETPSGMREARLVPFSVVKVCKKVVNGHSCSVRFEDLISAADAKTATDRYAEAQARKASDARRVNAAVGRIEHAGFKARTHYAEMQVAASVNDVEQVERLADIIVTGSRAIAIMAEFRAACPVVDAPMVTLHLSVEQAERALATLKGATFDDAVRLANGCLDYSGGHSGDCYDAFQHGIETVVSVLESWANGERSHQLRVVHGIGDAEKEGE